MAVYKQMADSSLFFVEKMFKLIPQPPKPEYKIKYNIIMKMKGEEWELGKNMITADWFGDYNEKTRSYDWFDFTKGKHITWQQTLFLLSAEKGLKGEAHDRVSVASGHGCHAKGQGIMMHDGSIRKVEDVNLGDKIMGDDGTKRTVLHLERGTGQMYRIKYHSGEYYDVNEDHVLALIHSNSKGTRKTGDKIEISVAEYLKRSDDFKRTTIGYKSQFEFGYKELPIDPYLLGVWLGDGTTNNGYITCPDKEIHNELLSKNSGRVIEKDKCGGIRIDGLTTLLKKNGILGHKHIPHEYKTSSREQRLELLAGLLDTDGYLSKNGAGYEIIQKQKELADGIVYLARSLGMNATINKKIGTIKSINFKGEYYRVQISRNIWNIPCRVERKKAYKPEKTQRERLSFGFTVEKLQVDDYYGFTVDENNLYVLEDFTVTRNCGKSSSVALLVLWFLFGRIDSQIACTAPNATQMNDVLWKELSLWIARLPEGIKQKFEWNKDYLRITDRPNSWFARAKTSTKENPEALAGVHADYVMMIADESSGVDDQIYHTMEGALTSGKKLVVLISNPTRNNGYFYDSHHKHKDRWQNLQFSSIESPIVDEKYEQEQADLHGRDSEQYGIRVLGQFPKEDAMDLEGFLPLISDRDVTVIPDNDNIVFRGNAILGVDPSGEGDDKTVMVLRDALKAKVIYVESISNSDMIAEKIITLIDYYDLDPMNVVVDAFGIGTNIAAKVAEATKGKYIITSLNVGEQCDYEEEQDMYENKRAFMFYAGVRTAMRAGMMLAENKMLVDELKTIRYKRNLRGKIQIMGKVQMKKKYGYSSPNAADALALTFLRTIREVNREQEVMRKEIEERENLDFDPYEAI